MRAMLIGTLALVLAAGCTRPPQPVDTESAASAAGSPGATATAFYTTVMTLPVGGVPDAAGQAALAPLVTADLATSLGAARAAEDAHTAATDNEEPPMLQGDIFGSMFEGRTGFVVADCVESGNGVSCDVAQSYSDQSGDSEWTDTVILVQEEGAWKVADVAYGGDWGFANRGRLSATLAAAAAAE